MKVKAIGYIRCSTFEQVDSGLGLDVQKERIGAYCSLKGLRLIEVITDTGVSGGKLLALRKGVGVCSMRSRVADARPKPS